MASMLCCSPVPAATAGHGAAGGGVVQPFAPRRKAHVCPAAPAVAMKDDPSSASSSPAGVAAVSPWCCDGGGAVDGAETTTTTSLAPAKKKKKAAAARWRPPRLVVPAVADADEAMVREAMAMAAAAAARAEKEEVVVEGEGFWLASRRGARHAMEDGYGVITHKIAGDSQLAFYGVYDGHGGRAAVDFVAGRLGSNVVAAAATAAAEKQRSDDDEASSSSSSPPAAAADHVAAAIRAAYLATDGDFLSQGTRGGACAATALVIDGDLYVANLGDCRAVLSRDGAATALTSDHTAARDDERTRIETSGGYVSCGSSGGGGGVWRVQDCLAVTRAFGDGGLKRWVVAEPEVTRTALAAGCEFLVIASDGLWNKVPNQEAVDVVAAAAVHSVDSCRRLVDMARRRGSRDDITVMVVDLKRFLSC
ncbi:probable protein phosphatase 2C 74 [Oryza brachyantha]|uniref:probable protein phosphatase 2C 74 n=1 Tax=Oryza brachyantha TaxID=4533 RepID=UPI001ADA6687|nr:probable protein phosphatase 2C 74 [Oryza brachyantha]